MVNREIKTAKYKIIIDSGGNRYRFFCEASGAAVCTTKPVRADTQEKELALAWEQEGKKQFNRCGKCGRFVCDTMYNADVCECVDCAPWEKTPNYDNMKQYGFGVEAMKQIKVCHECGNTLPADQQFCTECGRRLPEKTLYDIYKERHKTCPACDTVVADRGDYCPRCGENLKIIN